MEHNEGQFSVTSRTVRLIGIAAVCLLAVSSGSFAMDATSADNLATEIISQLGRSKGFVSLPNCGNGQLARAFLEISGMKVHAMDANQANVNATQQLMKEKGLDDGIRIVSDKGTLAVMPYTNRFADLIVITDLNTTDLALFRMMKWNVLCVPTVRVGSEPPLTKVLGKSE